ncbi:MAG: D-arabinono-1,4-lactone oxidase [Thermoleophilaceae bacterium]
MWKNWAGDQRCAPERIELPADEAELSRVVASAGRVKVAGAGHSFTDIACTDGVMLDLSRMNRVLSVDGARVTVEAGITIRELGPALAARGLALENQGDVDPQTITGAISTATHGTGGAFANISSQVTGVRVVTADGDAVELREGDELRAGRVSLGALGAISAVTLRCVPAFRIHRVDEPAPLDDVLASFDRRVAANDHFELFVFPYTRTALTLTSERTHRKPRRAGLVKSLLRDLMLENGALELACKLGRRFPSRIPSINRTLVGAMSRAEHLDASYRVYANRRTVRFTEMEYALPQEHTIEALERVLALVDRRRLPIGFPIEVRVAAPDDALLSTAHGRATGYVAVHQYRGMEFESYFRAVEAIMDEYGGRPHWGKRHYQTSASLRSRYPGFDGFLAVRERLDPDRKFENDYLRRVLG